MHDNFMFQRSRFTKCTLCDLFARKIPAQTNKELRELLTASRTTHLQRVRYMYIINNYSLKYIQ